MREVLDVALESAQQRRVRFLPPAAPTSVLEDSPSLGLPPAGGFGEKPRLANTRLTGQQQQRRSVAGKVSIEQQQLASAPY